MCWHAHTLPQETLGYNQKEIGIVAVASDIGGNVGLLAGVLSGILPDWAMLLIGASMVSLHVR